MYSVIDIARYILDQLDIPNMTHKKLQKLCYYVQAWSLAVLGHRMMSTHFEAWVHGPVSPELYHTCKGDLYGITRLSGNEIQEDDRKFIDTILLMYRSLTGDQLEILTHSEMPWKEARRGSYYWEPSSQNIKEDTMAEYYRNELDAYKKNNN